MDYLPPHFSSEINGLSLASYRLEKDVTKMTQKRQFIAIIVILIFGIGLFYVGTDGFSAFTAETARTNDLLEEKPKLPEVTLEDSLGEKYGFSEFEGKYMLMTFIYTACSTVCPQLEMNAKEIYDQIPEEYIGDDIMFLSVSFDPERDTPEILNNYRENIGGDGETWRMARIQDEQQLEDTLDEFDIIVIPDGDGDYAHNVAFYLVDREGYLLDIMDFQDIDGATEKVMHVLEQDREG